MTSKQANIISERGFKRSIDGILNTFANLRNQKSPHVENFMKNAFYNVILLIFLCVLALVFLILMPFIRPLAFGILFGAVLFPMKKKLSNSMTAWIDNIDQNNTPILLGLISIPMNAVDCLGKNIILFTFSHIKVLLFGSGFLITLRILVHFLPKQFFNCLIDVILWNHSLFENVIGSLNQKIMCGLIIFYITTIYILWNDSREKIFILLGQSVWILLIAYFCSYLGVFQIPAFIGILCYGVAGFIYHDQSNNQIIAKIKNTVLRKDNKDDENENENETLQAANEHKSEEASRFTKTKNQLSEIKSKMQLNVPQQPQGPGQSTNTNELESDWYFKILFYAFAATILWKQLWIVFLCAIPIVFYGLKSLCKVLGLFNYMESQLGPFLIKFNEWFDKRKYALIPIFLPGVFELNTKLHKIFCEKMKSYVHDLSALIMIIFLIFFVLSLAIFSFFQIYSETIAVVELGGNLVNKTLTLRPELIEMIPFDVESMDHMIDNAYQYSRSTIEEYLDSILNGTDKEQSLKFKTQIISVWDRLIQSYMDKHNGNNVVGPRVTSQSVFDTLDEIITSSGMSYTSIIAWAKNNLSVMKDVGDSLYLVLRTNISLLFSILTTFATVVIGSGHFMLTFLFDSVIFFTTLYYLLQSSRDRYAPIALNTSSSIQLRLIEALESSVSSVLISTMKLSLFHGLFTFVTHTIFGAHLRYLPSYLAAIFAAAPFLESYWCAIPAFLDLWLSQDRFYLGLLLVLIHFIIPPNFNVIIHSEIKGAGHPYLTALSIAGGIYLLGLEGAIIGPLLLCLLIVLFDVTVSSLNSPSPTTFTLSQQTSIDDPTSPAT